MKEALVYAQDERQISVLPLVVIVEDVSDGLSAEDEYIWSMDFKNDVTATMVLSHGLRTYGDLARLSRDELQSFGLSPQEVSNVSTLLAARGLNLADNK